MRRPLCALILALTLAPSAARATWFPDPVTGGRVVSAASAFNENFPTAILDGSGGTFTAYQTEALFTGKILAVKRFDGAGNVMWATNVASAATYGPSRLVADGAGGVIIVWSDNRSGFYRGYAQKLNASGAVQWTAGGLGILSAINDIYVADAISDGAGGVWVGTNYAAYGPTIVGDRISSTGVQYTGGAYWCSSSSSLTPGNMCKDGAGGVYLVWADPRSGTGDQLFGNHLNASGSPLWGGDGMAISSSPTVYFQMTSLAADGAGNAIAIWSDLRNGITIQAYGAKVNGSGTALWTPGGTRVTSSSGSEFFPSVVPDGTGGVFFDWADDRGGVYLEIRAGHLDAAGGRRWAPDGLPVCTVTGGANTPTLTPDGLGGVIIAWRDFRYLPTRADVFAQRYSVAGTPQWVTNGVEVCSAPDEQTDLAIAADGLGGAVIVFSDFRSGTTWDIYAQKVDRYGVLGNPAPAITRLRDVSGDQGGHLAVEWSSSYLDRSWDPGVTQYSVWRRVPTATALAAVERGASLDRSLEESAPAAGRFVTTGAGLLTLYWEYVAALPAAALPGYSFVATTTTDSLSGSNPRTSFMVAAENGPKRWFSAADSGYSVDNLPPATPAPFTGAYLAGATHLHWLPNPEADLAGYRLYRGTSPSFPADPAHFVADLSDTGYADAGLAGRWYKLAAVDAHGNESPFATLGPGGTVDAPGTALAGAWFSSPQPNPSRGPSAFRFGLASGGRVTLVLFDAAGRIVRTLADASYEPGEHALRWDGRDGAGRAASPGLYFARIKGPELVGTRRVVVIE